MQQFVSARSPFQRSMGKIASLSLVGLLFCVAGCGAGPDSAATPTVQAGPQTYFAPFVTGTNNDGGILNGSGIYALDDAAGKISQSTFNIAPPQQGPQVINAGNLSAAKRGLLDISITANYIPGTTPGSGFVAVAPNSSKQGFAIELAGQSGGLVQLPGQPVAPLVAAVQCLNLTDDQPYQFITIPGALNTSGAPQGGTWSPTTETAYGSVDISFKGSAVTFKNINQYMLPSTGGTKLASASMIPSGVCGPTVYGNTITVPGELVIKNPGGAAGQSVPPQATFGIGSTGLLVEDNGVVLTGSNAGQYQNVLGAGTGAVGLPKPSSALDTNALVSAQYLGFIYGGGTFAQSTLKGWSSHLASFGFSSVPSTCGAVTSGTNTSTSLIYGSDFNQGDPSTSTDGFGNCDLAIDLGNQDSNGLFTNAKVWLPASYAANPTGASNMFSAVAIAGQLKGKFALFLLGVDSTQPWAIYLLQSN
ncbi:hypothetical protein [Terriglobus saanensis]|uniref:Lipoprotein n=1 Tax=Terriglobus saanensis (strain ATCC BAA-1853 / DSM 23119 / SP1PR4) TaxID=401053 RepID=E8V070_TERSS|nr:hypothetical protein [Terriglobus saanensis]ADV83288.1 hypothetical protein AciPR4_2509 [Terriglobus saanensis SP1PR4]